MSLVKGIHHVCLKCSNEKEYEEVIHLQGYTGAFRGTYMGRRNHV